MFRGMDSELVKEKINSEFVLNQLIISDMTNHNRIAERVDLLCD